MNAWLLITISYFLCGVLFMGIANMRYDNSIEIVISVFFFIGGIYALVSYKMEKLMEKMKP